MDVKDGGKLGAGGSDRMEQDSKIHTPKKRKALISLALLSPAKIGTPKKHLFAASLNSPSADRFIPVRSALQKDLQLHNLTNLPEDTVFGSPKKPKLFELDEPSQTEMYQQKLAEVLFDCDAKRSRVLPCTPKSPARTPSKLRDASATHEDEIRENAAFNRRANSSGRRRGQRDISSQPERILDAPELVDDFYLNVLDWGSQNIVAVGLGTSLYLWNAGTGAINQMYKATAQDNIVTSVKFNEDGTQLTVGCHDNSILLYDVAGQRRVKSMAGHTMRVSSLAWSGSLLASGSRDTTVLHHDPRAQQNVVARLEGHGEEICGLRWNGDGSQLASGGNDNMCFIWDRANTQYPRIKLTCHKAAVKALAWHPSSAVLATGGGTADRHIRFFNSSSGQLLHAVDVKSQVCSVLFAKSGKELLSAHGFSMNQLTIWKYPSMQEVKTLTGHTSRVLHAVASPDGTTVVSAAADETLRFWSVWEPYTQIARQENGSSRGDVFAPMNLR